MQPHFIPEYSSVQSRGGRISSPKLRASIEQSEDFAGLEENTNHYDLLILVKRAGREAGFTSKMIELLDYYMAFTRDMDWSAGSRPIVFQSLSKTAMDLGVTERQIQNLEKSLFEVGALTWYDSGNHKRYGKRCPETGEILFAYGVDLTPLAYQKEELQNILHEKQLYQQAWMETKRQISYYRSQIRAVLAELIEAGEQGRGLITSCEIEDHHKVYENISIQIRSHIGMETLRELLCKHKHLHAELLVIFEQGANMNNNPSETSKTSSRSEENCTHNKVTIKKPFIEMNTSSPAVNSFQESSSRFEEIQTGRAKQKEDQEAPPSKEELILSTGLQHITLKQALNASSEEFKAHIPMEKRAMIWYDMVEAAFKRKTEVNISQSAWGRACSELTREGAAICVLLTDQGMNREKNPVRKPGAYFNAMIKRAGEGKLNLHKSIMGLLKLEEIE